VPRVERSRRRPARPTRAPPPTGRDVRLDFATLATLATLARTLRAARSAPRRGRTSAASGDAAGERGRPGLPAGDSMSNDDLHYLSASEALARFAARTLSPVELVRALIARSEAVEPRVRAFAHTYFERALDEARRAEARYGRGGAAPRPLEGVPVAIKDLHPIAGETTTHGSLVFADNRDETTLETVRRLLAAGAILLARTTTPEFGSATVTHSKLWGVTRNPWNLAFSPGGSSGGAGAALAAGTTTLADGSDYGGSIRIPASCCGLVGYKPPYGRNPGDPGLGLDPFSHFGPLARTAADAARMQNVMAGWHEGDVTSLPERVVLADGGESLAGWRVAYSMDLGYVRVDPEVAANAAAVLDALRDLGCAVEPVELGWTDRVRAAYEVHHAAADAAALADLLPTQGERLTDYARHEIERGLRASARDLFAAHRTRAEMYETLGPVLARCDLFVCPTTALPAVPAEHSPLATDLRVAGEPVPGALGWVLTYPFNMLGPLPVLAVPSGRSRSGVPTGVQLVARPYDDGRVFRAAFALERALGRWFDDGARRPSL
jgi:amidase